jgi:alpha-glucuronidase
VLCANLEGTSVLLKWAWASLLLCAASAHAEDGYDLWLRYRPVEAPWAVRYRSFATEVVAAPGGDLASRELQRGVAGLLAVTPGVASRITRDGAIVLGTPGAASEFGTPPAPPCRLHPMQTATAKT